MTDIDTLGIELEVIGAVNAVDLANNSHIMDDLMEHGKTLGRLYTDHGLPIDMSISKYDIPKELKIIVLNGALKHIIDHKRKSGASEKAIERTRKSNRKAMDTFIKKGEVGIY